MKGEPRTLVLAGDDAVAAELVDALTAQQQKVDTIVPEALPTEFASLATYDSVVLRGRAPQPPDGPPVAALQDRRDLGKGLVMIGGPDSYGAGGYQKTPLEETLPVDMGVRDRQKQPDVALIVVIDQSGSMDACHCNSFDGGMGGGTGVGGGVRKVDIGKEAIPRAAAALTERDELGVVSFNEQAHWVVKTQPLGGIADLQGTIAGLQPLGQTNIFARLEQAVESLEDATATRRHIILLTDGWSSSGQYEAILARMKAAGITLSTVGAGGGSNPFLEGLAREGWWPFLRRREPGQHPGHLPQGDAAGLGRADRRGAVLPDPDLLVADPARLRRGMPRLRGYNGTTAKAAAQTVLVTARDDPLLAQWQYGLGRSVAWTSDSTGRWARDWVGWDGFSRFFSQLVSWTFPGEETGGIEAVFDPTGARPRSTSSRSRPTDRHGISTTRARSSSARPRAGRGRARAGGPGRVRGSPWRDRPGRVRRAGHADTTWLVPPRSHGRAGRPDRRRVPHPRRERGVPGGVAHGDGRQRGRDAPRPVAHDLVSTSRSTDLWPMLLVLALLLWPIDIALRRVSVGRREFAAAGAWVRAIPRRRRRTSARTATGEGLFAARERATSASVLAAIARRSGAGHGVAGTAAGVTAPSAGPATARGPWWIEAGDAGRASTPSGSSAVARFDHARRQLDGGGDAVPLDCHHGTRGGAGPDQASAPAWPRRPPPRPRHPRASSRSQASRPGAMTRTGPATRRPAAGDRTRPVIASPDAPPNATCAARRPPADGHRGLRYLDRAPEPTPADFQGIATELTTRGIAIDDSSRATPVARTGRSSPPRSA